jgi:uncharacterized membrane protein
MNILNPIQMNDWEINKFIKVVLSIQVAVIGLIYLEELGLTIPIIREIFGLIYLLFIPGILILRILKLHNLGTIETLLYSIGLSIASIMSIGFLMNIFYPLIGLEKPIGLLYLIITLFLFVITLIIITYIRDKKFSKPSHINIRELQSPKTAFICVIPFLTIFGTYLVNNNQNNLLLMIMVLLIGLIVILVAFDKISKNFYPFILFIISLSLLFHTSLISQYLWGWDIHHEYYLANLVLENSLWNMDISFNTNAMLSIVMLAPIISKIADIGLIWVFKIVYPLIFSLVPLGLYLIFKKQMNSKIAFLSVFFFISIFTFFGEMNQLARQQIAEFFLVLVILLITNKSINKIKKSLLTIIFAISIIVSHYGLSYIFMLSLVGVYFLIIIGNKLKYRSFMSKFKTIIPKNSINPSFVFLFIIFAIAWYMYISDSSIFNNVIRIGNQIIGSIYTDFLNPDASQGAAILLTNVSTPIREIPKNLNFIFQFFILFGLISTFFKLQKTKFNIEFFLFSLLNLIILILSIILPFFASALNITRIYHISLLFLSPFSIIGGLEFFKIIAKKFNMPKTKRVYANSLKILSIMLVVLFLFYTGFIYEITNESPTSISLSKIDYPLFHDSEFHSSAWLNNVEVGNTIYADEYRKLLFSRFGKGNAVSFKENFWINPDSYIFFGKHNIIKNQILIPISSNSFSNRTYVEFYTLIENKNKIYDNNNSEIYYKN